MIHSVAFVIEKENRFFVNISLNETQMEAFGQRLGAVCQHGSVVYLDGTLGMGKTTLSRFVVQGLGWTGKVKSPTYTLVEQYDFDELSVFHFDLYRLSDPEELEFMGIRDIDAQRSLWLVEWPDKGRGYLPPADLIVQLTEGQQPDVRTVQLHAQTERGQSQRHELQKMMESQS